jgi:hypothetical protein
VNEFLEGTTLSNIGEREIKGSMPDVNVEEPTVTVR